MTLEEAVEVILQGNPFVECKSCGGMGYFFNSLEVDENGEKMPRLCPPCNMTGQVVRAEYRKACNVLGRPVPKVEVKYHSHRMDMLTPLRIAQGQRLPIKTVMKAMEALGMLPTPSRTEKSR
jgi:hypothetical protein